MIRYRIDGDLPESFSDYGQVFNAVIGSIRRSIDSGAEEDDLAEWQAKLLNTQSGVLRSCHKYLEMDLAKD